MQDSKGIVHGLREDELRVGHWLPLRFVVFAPLSCIQPPTLGPSRFANLRAGIRFSYMYACALLALGIACARGRLTSRISLN